MSENGFAGPDEKYADEYSDEAIDGYLKAMRVTRGKSTQRWGATDESIFSFGHRLDAGPSVMMIETSDQDAADRKMFNEVVSRLHREGRTITSYLHEHLSQYGWGDYTVSGGGPRDLLQVTVVRHGVARWGRGTTEQEALASLTVTLMNDGLLPSDR